MDETPAGAVTISKREAISNNTVLDNNTGLVWLRYPSVKMGSTSAGKMPWYDKLYDIFAWCAACNTASVGGYTDWRVPNVIELASLHNYSASTLDETAFPTSPNYMWTSNTSRVNNAQAIYRDSGYAAGFGNFTKTDLTTCQVFLVRGG